MPTTNRQYGANEKPHYVFNQTKGVNAFNKYFYVKVGVIQDIDYDRYTMSIIWVHGEGAHSKIPISFAYVGPAGCIGTMPEIGSIGIFGFFDEGGGKGSPLLLSFLPSGLSSAIDHNTVKLLPDAIPTDDVNEIMHKFRPLREGDMIFTSPKGGTLFVNNNVELHDSEHDMIMIREDDRSIIQTSISNFVFADGASVIVGPAIRNGLVLYDDKFIKNPDHPASSITGSSGRESIYMVPGGAPIDNKTRYYAEYRVDVDEYGDGKLDLNDINGQGMLSMRDPVVTMALGNYIGANKTNNTQYGRILKPMLFRDPSDKVGNFSLSIAVQNNGLNEPEILGLAYALHFQKSGTFIGVDKEGHLSVNLARSSTNHMGAGRSMSILAQGNLKEVWGQDANDGNSWDLATSGGVKWDIGRHTTGNNGRSFDLATSSGVSFYFGGADSNGYAKQETSLGNVVENTSGTYSSIVGSANIVVNGLKTENVEGSVSEICHGDRSINVLGVFTEVAVKEKQCKFGVRKTTITTGNDETTILVGNIAETLVTFGKRTIVVASGEISNSVVVGNYSTTIGTGFYKVNVMAGAIEVKTAVGAVTIAGSSVTVSGLISVIVDAPLVKLGSGALIGGAVSGLPGNPTHFDYTTGAPHMGSSKVSVG